MLAIVADLTGCMWAYHYQGDGGSPLACKRQDGNYELAGVVAFGVDCGMSRVPELYLNVAATRVWIDELLSKHEPLPNLQIGEDSPTSEPT